MFDDGHSARAVVDEQIIFTASKTKGITKNQVSVLKRPTKKLPTTFYQQNNELAGVRENQPVFG